jgi:hypothetical protein
LIVKPLTTEGFSSLLKKEKEILGERFKWEKDEMRDPI